MRGLKRPVRGQQLSQQPSQLGRLQRVRTVGLGFLGIVVNFQEHAIHSRPHGCASEHRNKLRLAAACRRSIFISVRG